MKSFFTGRAVTLALAAVCAGSTLLSGCERKNAYVAPPPAKISVATPVQAPVTLYAEFTGSTAPSAMVDVEARVQGFLQSIGYRDGAPVKKGQVLFEIEKDQYQAQVDLQKATLASAQATEANAKSQYGRQSTLGQKSFASQSVVEDTKTKLDAATADVAMAQAKLKTAETSLSYTTVKAPFDGVATRHLADVGALVGSSGVTKLATVLQVDPILVYFTISEKQQLDMRDALAKQGKTLKDMREGARDLPFEIALGPDLAFSRQGKIDYIAPDVESATGTLQLRGVLENPNVDLVPGLFVRVRVPVGKIDAALLVNDTAVQSNQTGSYVMVVGKDDVVEQRQVTTGPVEGQLRVITSGLKAGDRVVIGAIQRAIPGNKVAPENAAMAAAPSGPKPAPAALQGADSGKTTKP
ncbi:membrane fusion protein (multidrug efflux system) [Rhodoblastus acidophilus]|uniref:efflux RND transporter periplasmic adaptor subunit n=1 Tax=Rhodoblastus acidophilus TaxID=1074 RepID=UPI002224963C|nr:efflux RND transporter periplasmic adaptor subunit [Rhodoblastus acidophilus]MCW2283260.1 membrane fusion protein (multidrug efflux system) [Rhodoblastus acidophilus]MCW2332120.1 membrane fusion protein (multidrug efflux system) [Rhodoblastus acidophilus]